MLLAYHAEGGKDKIFNKLEKLRAKNLTMAPLVMSRVDT